MSGGACFLTNEASDSVQIQGEDSICSNSNAFEAVSNFIIQIIIPFSAKVY